MYKNYYNIVIVGGGAAGLKLASNLGNNFKNNKIYKITLIDKNKTYVWKPLLHMIASNSINIETNIINYEAYSRKNYFEFQLGEIIDIDRKNKRVILNDFYDNNFSEKLINKRFINYDILVLSIGGYTNDFEIPGVNKYSVKLDSLNDAKLCLKKIFNILIKLKYNLNSNYNIIIVGAGPTGVELSSLIFNLIYSFNNKNINNCFNSKIKIILIESGNEILPLSLDDLKKNAYNELIKIGINILLNNKIIKINENGVFTENNKFIKGDLIIWTTGIKISDKIKNIGNLETNKINQLIVLPNLLTTKDSSIFAIGDCAYCKTESGLVVPPKAQAAKQMSDHLFINIKLLINNKKINNFEYLEKGVLINLSKFNTFGVLNFKILKKKFFIKGFVAKVIYSYLHRSYQISIYGLFKTFLIIIAELILKTFSLY